MIMAILNFIELKFYRAYSSMKPHILFYRNGLAIWHGFPDITHIKNNADNLPFWRDLVFGWCAPIFELVLAIGKIDIKFKFWSDT